ncbi:MAG: hypothetical protein HOK84_16470 [Bacteroidetes bacterium]|nr:hypothetical protein [Bacteroidota bacterium]
MMELDDIQKVWKQANQEQNLHEYSSDEIRSFRKSRSRDFTKWIRNSLRMDFMIKALIAVSYFVLIILFRSEVVTQIICAFLAVLTFGLIWIERPHYTKAVLLDQSTESLQAVLHERLAFLKTFYFRIQFLVGLTNPLLVTVGSFFYYYTKYGRVSFPEIDDILVFVSILIISFLFTIPTTASMYGFHARTLQNSLASLEDSDHWEKAIRSYNRSKKILTWIFVSLMVIGIAILAFILLK